MSKRNVFNLILAIVMIIVLCGYFFFMREKTNSEEVSKQQIKIESSNLEDSEGLYTITFPPTLVGWASTPTQDINDIVEDYKKDNIDNKLFERISYSEDESITFKMTRAQLNFWIRNTEEYLSEEVNKIGFPFEIDISDDFSEIIYYTYPNSEQLDFLRSSNIMGVYLMQAQMFEGVPSDEWKLKLTIINKETDEVFREVTFPYDEMSIPQAEWEAEFAIEE